MSRPKLLLLSHRLPFPPHNGAAIRTYNLMRQLAVDFDVTALCFDRRDPALEAMPLQDRLDALAPFARCQAFPIPQLHSRVRLVWDHLRSVSDGQPYVYHVHESTPFAAALRKELAATRYDIVHIDSLDLLRFVPMVRHLPIACTHHNAESTLLLRRAAREKGLRSWYIRHQAGLLSRAESQLLGRFDVNITVSDVDSGVLRQLAPSARFEVIPNGVDADYFRPSVNGTRTGCVFVGGTTWFPNRDGLEWFAGDVLPRMRAAGMQDQVKWVGRITDAERSEFTSSGLSFTGYVDDIRPHVLSAACFIAPLRVGGGTRLKILDAWAMGAPVVATRAASEGLDAVHGENMLIADNADDFVRATAQVLKDRALASRIGAGGRAAVEKTYSWEVVGARLRGLYRDVLERRARVA
jgi:glycosyltransferase involved in cell wall biosynthesis